MSSSSFEKWASKYSDAHKEKYASRTKEDVQKGAKQYEKERDERLAKEYIKPDTIEKDIEELGAIVNNAYNDWQDPNTMASTKDRVTRMKNRLSVYETWKKKYGKNSKYDISGIISAYKGVLDDWDGLSKIYSRYDNKEQYQSAKKIEETAKKYIDVIGRDHTFTEEEELKKSIDDIILDYKAKYPENYAKNRDFFDETIKYAIDNDYRSGVQGAQALARNIEAYKSSVKNGDTKSAETAKQAAWADVQNIKKNAPKYYAENASGIFNLYSGVLSSDEIANISKEFSDSVRDSIWTPEMQNEYNKNAQEMDSIKNAVGEWVYDSRIRGFRNTVTGETKSPDQYNALSDEEKKPLENNARYNELEKRNAQLGLIRSNAVDKQAYVDYTISREWELSKFKDKYGDEWYYGNGKHPNTKQASEIILDIFSQKEEENAQTSAISAGLSPIPTTAPVFESAFKSANEDLYDKAKKGLATEADLREVINKIYGEGFVTDEDINRLGVMYSKKSGDGRASSNPWSDYSKSFLDPRYNVMTEEATRAEYERIANEGSFAQKSGARLIGLGTSFISAIPAAAESMVSAVDSNIKKAELPNYKTHKGYGLFSSLKSGTDEGRAAIATNQNADVLEFLGMNKEDAKNWGSGIYSVTNGIAENLMRAPLGPTMAGIMMFSQSFSSEYKSGVDSYKDPTKNAVSSITSAVSEGLTEKIELGAFGKALSKTRFEPNLFKRAIKAGVLSGGNEILGELSNDAVRYISDYALNGEESDLAREARKLVVNGKASSIDNAVFKILAKNGLNTAVVSFISGDVLGGIGGLTNYVDASDIRRDGEKLINSGADINEIIKLGMSSSNKETRELAANLENAISKDGKIDGLDVQLLFSSVINDAADNKINVGEVDDFVKNLSKSEETPDTIETAAESALENAIADVSKTNSTESGKLEATKADAAKRTIPLDDKKPKVTVATKDGGSVTVNGREFVTINGRGIYIVDGSQLGASQKYYAVDSSTGKAIAASDTNKKLTNAVYDFKAEMEKADSYIKDDIDSFEEYIDVASDIAVDRADTVVETADSNGDVAVAEIDSPVEVSETAKKSGDGGKKTTVTLISKDGLKTYEGVSVAEDTGYELTAVERNGGITIVEKRSGMEFAHGATVQEAIAKVRNTIEKNGKDAVDAAIEKAIERRKASVNTSAGSTSSVEGDRLSVGRAVADADYTNTLLEMAKTSKNEKARKAAELYSSYDFKDDNERYRALGDIAKILGVSEADLVKSRAKSLFAKIRASISSGTDVVDKTNAKIYEERQAAVSRGDTATVKALDYLTNLLNSEGSIISVSEMFAPNQYSAENPNVAVQVYGKRMETAFKNIGLDISVSVYYDSSENAARGEWTKHPNGHSEIKLNGAKLQGEQSAFWVVSHELIHEAESKSPGITQRMLDAFTKMGMYDGSQYEAYKTRYSKKCEADFKKALDRGDVTQDDHDEFVRNYVNEEIVADLMSETMSSSELVEVFAGKLGKDDANVIVSFLKKLLNGVKKVFNSKDEFPNKFSDIIGMFEGAVKGESAVNKDITSTKTQIYKEDFEIDGEYDTEYDNYGVRLYPKKELSSSEYDELEKELQTRLKNVKGVVATARPTAGYIKVVSGSPFITFDENLLFDKTKSSDAEVTKKSLSSIGAAFYGNEKMTANEMARMLNDGSWKESEGYKKYLDDCVNVYKQAYGKATKSDIAQIEKEIEGIMRVAVAAKKAGYDILDNGAKRSTKDSKNRLLFSSLEPNSDYITSSDISAICDKRKTFTEIYDEIVRIEEANNVAPDERFFSKVDNYFILHKIMAEKGLVVPCEECYVESMRKNLAPMANAFITLVKETNAENKKNAQLYNQSGKSKGKLKENNAKIREKVIEICAKSNGTQEQIDKIKSLSADELAKFIDDVGSAENLGVSLDELTLPMLTTAEGLAKLKLRSPLLYEAFNSFYGQSKPKMPKEATPFRPGELIALFTDKNNKINTTLIEKVKSTGGFRLQSYSDFQIGNFVDVLQTIFEASMLGLNGHAYTKVPAFLDATNGTNLKRNLSIFMYEDGGKWMLDKKNSFPMELDDIYALVAEDESGNTSIIAVSQNAKMSAWIMANDLVGYGIPFHKSGLKMDIVRLRDVKTPDGRTIKGYSNQIDHTKQQSEVYKYDKDGKKKNSKVSKPIDIYSFWDFENKEGLSKNELIEKNLKAYIDECEKAGYRPKFRDYVMNNDKVLKDVLAYSKELGFVSEDATIDDISFEYGEYRIPYGYYKFLGDFGMFTPEGEASPIKPLSLAEYDFDKAVSFFNDAKALREKELLQQFENGKVREEYRQLLKAGKMTYEELQAVLDGKKNEVVQEVVTGAYKDKKYALQGKDKVDNEGNAEYNEDTQNLGGVNDGNTRGDAEEIQRVSSYSKGVSERASERRNISNRRRGSGNSYQNDEQQIRYNELSAYEKSRVNEILYTPIDESDNLRFVFNDMSISEAIQRICEIIESEPNTLQFILDEVPDFANAIDKTFRFLNRNKDKPKNSKKTFGDSSPSGAFDSNGNELSKAQNEMFKDSKARDKDGNLLVLYHGSRFSDVYEFDMYMGVWLTPDIDYARKFANFEDSNIHSLYANITNPADIGQINGELTTQRVGKLADALGVKRQKVILAAKSYLGGRTFDFTRSADFIDIAREVGFDGFKALEGDVDTYCAIISADQVKNTDNKTPTHSTDTRHSLDDTGVYSLEDAWAEMTKKYGAIPKGEKAARDIKVPKKISDNKYVSRTARSAIEAGITPAEFVPELQKEILDGKFTYERFPDEKAEAKAKETIEYHGFEGALEHWEFLMHSGGAISKENFSLGIALYNQCAQNGDFARAEKILADLSVEATRAGQAIQSMRLLKKMSADGTMYYLEKSIDKINDELVEKFGEKRAKKVKINEELARKYFAEKDAKKREKLYDELCKDIGEQIPSTLWEKADAWRYLMMLFNLITHIRNIFGNIFNKFVVMADHAVEGALQPIFVKQENRTRTWRIADKKTADFAKNDWELMKDVLTSGEGKYNNMMSDIDKNRRILRPSKNAGKVTKVVGNTLGFIPEVLRKFNSWGLEAEDAIFLGASYKSALRKIITARKLNVDNITPEQLSEIRDLAIKDALRATFREANWLAESISKAKSNLMKGNAGQKLAGIALGGVFPFTKTPMNITKQALEHSPLGVFKTASDIVKKARGGAVSGNDIVADLARTFTGTGLAVLGFVLARAGFVSAGDDEDPDKKRFDKLVGEQSYAITIGGKSYTIDWATPASIPFLVGAQLFDATSDSGINIKTAMDSLTKIAEPVIGLSMLDGLRDFMQSDNYAEGQNPLFAGAYSTLESYALQFFPTLGGKIHRIYDGEKKNYYFVDKNSNVPEFVQELYGSVASKLPFAVGDFQPSVDLWGRVENHGGIGERLAENLISPGYYSEENYTEVDEELLRLYESTGNGDVFPKKMYEDITISGNTYYMNAEQYKDAAVMLGERRFDMLSRLFNDEIVLKNQDTVYSEMTDSEKSSIVMNVYKQALDETKYAMLDVVSGNAENSAEATFIQIIKLKEDKANSINKGNPTGVNGVTYVYWKQKNNFIEQAQKAIDDGDKKNAEGFEKDLEKLAGKYDGKLSRGDKLIAENYDKVGNDDVFYTDAESYVLKKSKDGIKYEMPMSYHDYKSMTKYMDDAKEYAALYVFGNDSDKSSASKIRNQTDNMKTWIAGGLKATNSAMKGNYDLYKKGKLSADEYNAIYYDTLVGKIKTEIRAYYREIYFKKHK